MIVKYLPSYYRDLEREVAELAEQLSKQLSDKEREWIDEWIAVGEYGLAVIVVMENLQKNRSEASDEVLNRVRELALRIGLDDEVNLYIPKA